MSPINRVRKIHEKEAIDELAQKICNLLYDEGYATDIGIYREAQKFLENAYE